MLKEISCIAVIVLTLIIGVLAVSDLLPMKT